MKSVRGHAKKIHHAVTKKKVIKKRHHQHNVARGAFVFIATLCMGGLTFAIATTKPTVEIEARTNVSRAIAALNPGATAGFPEQVGMASWYALGLPAPDSLTCASTKYPRGTYLLVKNTRNQRSVICLVNDYGPEAWTNRAVDLSRGSFRIIEDLSRGTAPVQIWVVPPPASFNLPMPTNFSRFLGYSLCGQKFKTASCERFRKLPIRF